MTNRVLVIRIGRFGDTILATPIIHALRQAFGPKVRIDFAAGPGASAGILRLDQRINQVFPITRRALPWYLNASKRALRQHSEHKPYDLVFNLECGTGCDDFIRFVSAREFFGRPLSEPRHVPGRHCVDTEKTIYAEALGLEATAAAVPCLQLTPQTQNLSSGHDGDYVILNPGFSGVQKRGYRSHKRWPDEHWIQLIDLLGNAGYTIAVNGSAAEKRCFGSLLQHAGVDSLFGATLAQLIAAMRQARCVISVDTGSMHLATALGIPTIALFGPTDAVMTGPYPGNAVSRVLSGKVGCSPCVGTPLQKTCGSNRCMQELSPGAVYQAFEQMMQSTGRRLQPESAALSDHYSSDL